MKSRSLFIPGLLLVCAFASQKHAQSESKDAGSPQSGAALFRDKGCAFCHGADLGGTSKAPSLAGLNNDKSWPAARISNQILNGGQKMPPFRDSLDDNEISDLVAYLRAKVRPAPPAAGESADTPH